MVLHLARDCKYRRKTSASTIVLEKKMAWNIWRDPWPFFCKCWCLCLCIACCDAHWKPRTYVHAWVSVCVCHVCGDFLARCGTCSASQSEIPVDPLHDEAPIDQYERKNKKATWSCLWIIWFVYVFWHQSWNHFEGDCVTNMCHSFVHLGWTNQWSVVCNGTREEQKGQNSWHLSAHGSMVI